VVKRIRIIILILVVFLSGCWDRIELDRRSFVLGAALDMAPEDNELTIEKFADTKKSPLFMLTLETALIHKDAESESGNGGGNTQQKRNSLLHIGVGNSFFEILREEAKESDRILFFGHQQVIIIGEELARKHNILEVLDFWIRDPEVDRSMKILLARGNARELFNADPKNSKYVSIFIFNQSEQNRKSAEFINKDFTSIISELTECGNGLLGSIEFSENNSLRVSGSGVIKDCRLVGWLDGHETQAAQYVLNEAKGGEITVEDPEREGKFITVEISGVSTKLKVDTKNDIPRFTIDTKIECNITEIDDEPVKIGKQAIASVEKAVSAYVKKQIKNTVEKLQKQYKADALGFGETLKKRHNKLWKVLEKDWDAIYPEVPVSVQVSTKVRHLGRAY
jgi:Ger(x)C family germination protein